jgi:alpha-mannosidase
MSAKVRLWSFDKFDRESSLYLPAMETRIPVQAAGSKVRNGKLPITQSGLSLSRKGITVTAFGSNPDGEGIILRLWEQTGQSGMCTVTLPAGWIVDSVIPVDLRGRIKGNAIKVNRATFRVELKAYAPASFLIL